ncbi:hypothetical protein B9Z55_005700 [Caenorhabditis nigoni]|nr:hypothetical protein B9Z55_005700 [Caenorhabditis nigoni]
MKTTKIWNAETEEIVKRYLKTEYCLYSVLSTLSGCFCIILNGFINAKEAYRPSIQDMNEFFGSKNSTVTMMMESKFDGLTYVLIYARSGALVSCFCFAIAAVWVAIKFSLCTLYWFESVCRVIQLVVQMLKTVTTMTIVRIDAIRRKNHIQLLCTPDIITTGNKLLIRLHASFGAVGSAEFSTVAVTANAHSAAVKANTVPDTMATVVK